VNSQTNAYGFHLAGRMPSENYTCCTVATAQAKCNSSCWQLLLAAMVSAQLYTVHLCMERDSAQPHQFHHRFQNVLLSFYSSPLMFTQATFFLSVKGVYQHQIFVNCKASAVNGKAYAVSSLPAATALVPL